MITPSPWVSDQIGCILSDYMLITTVLGQSPVRQLDDIGPIKGINNLNNDLICGRGAQKAEMVIPAYPGSKVSFWWVGSGGDPVGVPLFQYT